MINAPQYQIAKFLISVLQPVSKKFSNYCIKDSFNFVNNLRNESTLPDNMCSFDIKSLLQTCLLKKPL